jgi:hypothetical protein
LRRRTLQHDSRQYGNDGSDQQHMYEAAERKSRHHTEDPENEQQDGDEIKHEKFLFAFYYSVCIGSRLLAFADLIADHAADCRASEGAGRTAVRQHGTRHAADTGTDRGIFLLLRHVGASTESKSKKHARAGNEFSDSVHEYTSKTIARRAHAMQIKA